MYFNKYRNLIDRKVKIKPLFGAINLFLEWGKVVALQFKHTH